MFFAVLGGLLDLVDQVLSRAIFLPELLLLYPSVRSLAPQEIGLWKKMVLTGILDILLLMPSKACRYRAIPI